MLEIALQIIAAGAAVIGAIATVIGTRKRSSDKETPASDSASR